MIATPKIKGLGLNLLTAIPLAVIAAIVSTSLSTVQSQPVNSNVEAPQLPKKISEFSVSSTPIPPETFLNASQYEAAFSEPTSQTVVASVDNASPPTQNTNPAPMPGTTVSDAKTLSVQPSVVEQSEVVQTPDPEVAQLPLDPGRATRGGSSYIGLGANVGLSGDTALGDGNLMIISKIGLTRSLALRPGLVLGDDATFLLPITYEFTIRQAEALQEALRIAPYIGAGVTLSTGNDDNDDDDSDIGLLLTGGIDIPLSRQFTANAGLNVGIADETDIGLSVGVGYNFGGFGL